MVSGLRLGALVVAAALVLWGALLLRARRYRRVGSALRWGGWACLAVPVVLAIAGLADFDALFTAFHGVFFEAETWIFPADSLLIELFPERFWVTAGAALALLVAVQGVALWLTGRARWRAASIKSRGPSLVPKHDKRAKTITLLVGLVRPQGESE